MIKVLDSLLGKSAFIEAFQIQQEVLKEFHKRSARVLEGECSLTDYAASDLSIERNIFSTLFLAAERCAGLPRERMPFYGLINQCMRAWVTGCDNILDDEYKPVLPFNLPEGGHRARSVLIIMTADRVFTDLLLEEMAKGNLTEEQGKSLSHYTLRSLIPSALQEDEEEIGAKIILSPEQVLSKVHVPKTGLLFEAPLISPEQMGEVSLDRSRTARSGLRAFGLACQILDDIVDIEIDLTASHHNFVLSLAVHGDRSANSKVMLRSEIRPNGLPMIESKSEACRWSIRYFQQAREELGAIGLEATNEEWRFLVLIIAGLLRVPPDCHSILRESL